MKERQFPPCFSMTDRLSFLTSSDILDLSPPPFPPLILFLQKKAPIEFYDESVSRLARFDRRCIKELENEQGRGQAGVQSAEEKRCMHQEPEPPTSKTRDSLDSFIHASTSPYHRVRQTLAPFPPLPVLSSFPVGMILWKSSLISGREDKIGSFLVRGCLKMENLTSGHRRRGRQTYPPSFPFLPSPPFTPATPPPCSGQRPAPKRLPLQPAAQIFFSNSGDLTNKKVGWTLWGGEWMGKEIGCIAQLKKRALIM